jgi:hypothetical protein
MPHSGGPAYGILVLVSIFRDSMPWLYELGMDLYRTARQGNGPELEQAINDFRRAVDFATHSPMSREFLGRSKEMYMLMEEIEPMLDFAVGMLMERKPTRRRSKKDRRKRVDRPDAGTNVGIDQAPAQCWTVF